VTGAERLELSALPASPWKNGGGTTREIAAHPQGAGLETFGWRLSVAEVERDGPFSRFPGIDRTIVLLRGAGMRLRAEKEMREHVVTTIGVPHAFPGEAAIVAHLVHGATSDFNVMTRRGQWSATVETLKQRAELAPADALLLLVGAGTWQVAGHAPLAPGQLLLWRAPVAGLVAAPAEVGDSPSWSLAVRLCHDRSS
jgi:environmental stress-induced protein Ves